MMIPLHIKEDSDTTRKARAMLAAEMLSMNPKGFRTPGKGKNAPLTYVEETAVAAGLTTFKELRAKPLPDGSRVRYANPKPAGLRPRAERRNEQFGRKPIGNTKPAERRAIWQGALDGIAARSAEAQRLAKEADNATA